MSERERERERVYGNSGVLRRRIIFLRISVHRFHWCVMKCQFPHLLSISIIQCRSVSIPIMHTIIQGNHYVTAERESRELALAEMIGQGYFI